MTDYPDWQAYPQWLSAPLYSAFALNLPPGVTVVYQGAKPAYSSVRLRLTTSAGYGTVTVAWYLDAGFTQQLGNDPFTVSPHSWLDVILPVLAPYVRVSVNVTSAVNLTGSANVAGVNVTSGLHAYPVGGPVTATGNVTVPAGSDSFFYGRFIKPGLAFFQFTPFDATGLIRARVALLNPDSTVLTSIAEVEGTTTQNSALCVLPNGPVAIWLTNTDAANPHSGSATLVGV